MLSLHLLIKEYLGKPVSTVRSVLLLSVIVSIALYFVSMPPIYENMRVAPYETADYSLRVNGPLTEEEVDTIASYGSDSLRLRRGVFMDERARLVSDTTSKKSGYSPLLVDNMKKASTMQPLNSYFIINGEFKKGSAVLSKDLADELGVTVGDTVGLEGTESDISVNYTVSGVIDPTSFGTNTFIADISDVRRHIDSDEKSSVYTDIYLKCPCDTENLTQAVPQERASIEYRQVRVEQEMQNVEALTESTAFRLTTAGGILLYLIVFVRDRFTSSEERTDLYGILKSMGSSDSLITRYILVEGAVLLGLTTLLGGFLTGQYYKYFLGQYLSYSQILDIFLRAFAINLVVVSVTSVLIAKWITRKDIVNLIE